MALLTFCLYVQLLSCQAGHPESPRFLRGEGSAFRFPRWLDCGLSTEPFPNFDRLAFLPNQTPLPLLRLQAFAVYDFLSPNRYFSFISFIRFEIF
jgi:hypothetical protein